jgi:hypothetical protein
MKKYNLDFICDNDLFEYVKSTVEKYRSNFNITLEEFNKNLIDPIKLTFDSKIHNKSIKEIIESEINRQLDKSNTNYIGYFHQNIFHYIGRERGWVVPKEGYDVVNESEHIYVEIKNKHNTMNSSSSKEIYKKMQKTVQNDPEAKCMLVEAIATKSQNIPWVMSVDKVRQDVGNRICRVSIDKFYEIVTGDRYAFKRLCEILPQVVEDVVKSTVKSTVLPECSNKVFNELKAIDDDLLRSLYLFSFNKYEGFNDFNM